ncbi:SapA-like protein [Legionella moravica]|uniref:SapA-like protein n=1 Tax=Legionella moravica TaxID=39962 RepID=A0A378JVV8_9GAMM|nr:outer membrane beta-barrel protein [Legionella moravica]KTD38460.1 SapA-like protein [Legionella moravica]STX62845.1 SapA-like protein [Legionella moravica]
MHKNTYGILLGLGVSLGCFAGDMGVQETSSFYIQGMVDYNWLNYSEANTASYFGPQNIRAVAASIDNRWGYGVGAGYVFNDYLRAGVTFQGRPNIGYSVTDDAPETASGNFNNFTVMFNAYLSSPSLSTMGFNPYIMGGVGVARNKTNDIYWPLANQIEFGASTTPFAWQAGLGTLFNLNDCLFLDINYTFVSIGEVKNSGQYNAVAANNTPASGAPTRFNKVYSNQAELGLHYRFSV